MKKFCALFVATILLVNNIHPSAAEPETSAEQETPNKKSVIKKIADINLQSFDWEERDWDEHTYVGWSKRVLKETLNPQPRYKRRVAFQFFKAAEKQESTDTPATDNSNVWKDLDLFCGKAERQNFVANSLDRTQTELGKISFYWLLTQPTTDIKTLTDRQNIIATIASTPELQAQIDAALTSFQQAENVLIRFWDKDLFKQNTEREFLFTSVLKSLNNSTDALFLKSLYGHQKRLFWLGTSAAAAAILISYGAYQAAGAATPEWLSKKADKWNGSAGNAFIPLLWDVKNRWIHALVALSAGIWCGVNAWQNIDWIHGATLWEQGLQTVMINIATTARSMQALHHLVSNNPTLANHQEFAPLAKLFVQDAAAHDDLQELLSLLKEETLQGEASLLSHKGIVLRAYALMHELKEKFQNTLAAIARLDAYASLAKLMTECEQHQAAFCFPIYAQAEKPFVQLTDFWHPMIAPNRTVTNSIALGIDGNRPNGVLTGPNEGGKSTTLKALTLCLLLAQTTGIAPARNMTLTPFSSIDTYLNITDDIGAGNSLFKAEVLRTQQLIDRVAAATPGQFHFAVFDEVFNGTSPVEGTAAAYSVAKHLGQFPNSICMVATHFPLLTQLEAETTSFSNYKVSVDQFKDGSIGYPYKLESGISHQHIALDILRNQGFDLKLVEEANAIVKQTRGMA